MCFVQRAGVVAALPYMPAGAVRRVPIRCKLPMNLFQAARQSAAGMRHCNEMMIGHKAIAHQVQGISLDALLQQLKVDLTLRVFLQDEEPGIPSLRNVVSNIKSNNARESHWLTT